MESKLRNEKVVDLRKILTDAKVAFPPKANKAELISVIVNSKEAVRAYEVKKGSGGASGDSGTSTPVPAVPAPTPAAKSVEVVDANAVADATSNALNDDLLAPPDEIDWSGDAATSPNVTSQSSKSPGKPVAEASSPVSQPLAPTTAADATAKPDAPTAAVDEDEETKKRRLRAERFNIPFVEPKKPAPAKPKQTEKAAKVAPVAATVQNGKAGRKAPQTIDDPSKLDARAARFGLPVAKANNTSSNSTKPVTQTTSATAGQKRSAPVDPEEEERKRKRAERFGQVAAK